MSRTSNSIRRIIVGVATGAVGFSILAGGATSAQASTAQPQDEPCGQVLLLARNWLGGTGVNVRSNGGDEGTYEACASGASMVNGVEAGRRWQCVELVNRLYLTKGWTKATWEGDAGAEFWKNTPADLAKEANGAVTHVKPGDVVDVVMYYHGKLVGGHVFIVNTGPAGSSGRVTLVSQNNSSITSQSATLLDGKLTVPGSGGWSSKTVGVIHAP